MKTIKIDCCALLVSACMAWAAPVHALQDDGRQNAEQYRERVTSRSNDQRALFLEKPTADTIAVAIEPVGLLGGKTAKGTLTVSDKAPATGATVTLASSNPAVAKVPASVTIPAGATTATFTIITAPVPEDISATITATYEGGTQKAAVRVWAPVLWTFTTSATQLAGDTPLTGTVKLSGPAPAGGAVVKLTSADPAVAAVPASVTIATGESSATFPITVGKVSGAKTVEVTATFGRPLAVSLTITP